jgi:FixJ family two-component response regulator
MAHRDRSHWAQLQQRFLPHALWQPALPRRRGVNNTSCLITDVHMPGLSGVELYQRLRVDGFAAPTIFLTGQPDETTRTKALAAGAVACLSKPFGKQALLDCLKAASLHHRG